jgi:hypothetical protein
LRAIGLTKPSGAVKAKSCLQLEGRRVSRSPAISNQPRIVARGIQPGRRARVAAEIRLGVGRRAASRRQGALSPASGEPRPVRWRSGARRGGSCAEQSVQNLQPSEVDPSLDRGCRRGHTPRVVRARSTLATLLAASRDRVPGTDSRAWVAQGARIHTGWYSHSRGPICGRSTTSAAGPKRDLSHAKAAV